MLKVFFILYIVLVVMIFGLVGIEVLHVIEKRNMDRHASLSNVYKLLFLCISLVIGGIFLGK